MKDARPAARPCLVLALLLATLSSGLNAAPAGDTPPATPPAAAPPPAAAAPAPPPTLIGKIAHIRIFGSKNVRADPIQAVLTQKVGDLYSPAAAARDQATIKDMGVFNGPVTLTAAPNPAGGVDLNYTVAENPIVTAIRFTADTPSKEPTIPALVLVAQMKTRVGQVLNTKVLVSDLDALVNHDTGYVSKQGYIFDISTDINIDPATGVLTIPLVEAHVQSIQITGNSRIKTADILAHMHTKPGDVYNANAVQKDLGAIYEMGDFKQVGGTKLDATGPGQITVTLPVVEREAATVDKLDEKQGKVIPFLYDPITIPTPVIRVSVNGKPPLAFIVDTGTTAPLTLDTMTVARLGLKKQELTQEGQGYRYAVVPVQKAVLQGVNRANDVPYDINQAVVLDLGILRGYFPGRDVAGIIGLGLFRLFTTRFDFAAETLTMFAYSHPSLRLPGATLLPLRSTSDELYTVHAALTPDAAADLILDTGSDSTQVPLETVGTLHPAGIAYNGVAEQITGLYICPDLRLPGLNLGTLRVPNVVVGTLPLARTSLGMDILGGYRLTLDGPNAQFALEPSATSRRYVLGWSGLELTQAGSEWKVKSLRGGSPARQAGVQTGDEIATVNGQGVQGLSRTQAMRLIDGLSGTPQRLGLRRGHDKSLGVSWTPLDEFSAPRDSVYGLTLRKPNGGPWVIVSVLSGCPGDRAGLQASDEITQMDGVPTANMPPDRLAEIMSGASKSIPLTVTRAGRAAPFSVKLSAPAP